MSERHGWRQAGDEVESGRGHGRGGGPHLDAPGSTQLSARCDRQQPTTKLPRPAPETGEQRGSTRRIRLGRACPQSQRALGRAVGVTAPPSSRGAVRPTPPSARGETATATRRGSRATAPAAVGGPPRNTRRDAAPARAGAAATHPLPAGAPKGLRRAHTDARGDKKENCTRPIKRAARRRVRAPGVSAPPMRRGPRRATRVEASIAFESTGYVN